MSMVFQEKPKEASPVPNLLFFSNERSVDLSKAYGDKGRKKSKVRGLLKILHAYNFTVEENTPVDEEIAPDPELLGRFLRTCWHLTMKRLKRPPANKQDLFIHPGLLLNTW